MEILEAAHKHSINNMPALKKDKLCGCFYCSTYLSQER